MRVESLIRYTFIVCVFFGTAASGQSSIEDRMLGCYQLKVGPWTPPLGAATKFSTPPDTVRLFADSNYQRSMSGWKRADPPIRHPYSRGRERAYWTRFDSTSFRIVWSDGFTGADLRLYPGNEAYSYYGIIRMLSDAIGPEESTPKATVVAKRVECAVAVRR